MKLAPLLAQYLYDHHELQLAGLGRFSLDSAARTPDHASEGITFEFNPSAKNDDSLVDHISRHTGKMKTLAASDLHSYTELAREFLNIGKPFQIEDIGTLVKNKNGELEFTPGHLLSEKIKQSGIKELSQTSISDESLTTYETLKPHGERSSGSKKVFLSFLAVITVAAIVWIGYRTYRSNPAKDISEEKHIQQPTVMNDTTNSNSPVNDTTARKPAASQKIAAGKYRFVIEVASRNRALYRFKTLRNGNVPVQLSTNDSVHYKLFFVLPATTADTARIADSLTTWYPAMNHRKAFAEESGN